MSDDIDFLLEEDEDFFLSVLMDLPTYECSEVVVQEEQFQEVQEFSTNECLQEIPPVHVQVLDEGKMAPGDVVTNPSPLLVTSYKKVKNVKPLVCEFCGKRYRDKLFYAKHISSCEISWNKKEGEDSTNNSSSSKEIEGDNIGEKSNNSNLASRSKQKKFHQKETIRSTDEELISNYPTFIKNILTSISTNPIYNIRVGETVSKGNKLALLAENLSTSIEKNAGKFSSSGELFLAGIVEIIRKTDMKKTESREKLWKDILLNCHEDVFEKTFENLLREVDTDSATTHSFGFIFSMNAISEIFRFENERYKGRLSDKSNAKLSSAEQQILHYVSGYIVFSFLKKYKSLDQKYNSIAAKDAISFFQTFKSSGDESFVNCNGFEGYVSKWTDLINRGGLVNVSSDFLSFICKVESAVKITLTSALMKSYCGEDIRDKLTSVLTNDVQINLNWQSLARNLRNERLSYTFFRQVIEKWVDIRANAFVNAHLQLIKRKLNAKSKRNEPDLRSAQPSLRKTLQ